MQFSPQWVCVNFPAVQLVPCGEAQAHVRARADDKMTNDAVPL